MTSTGRLLAALLAAALAACAPAPADAGGQTRVVDLDGRPFRLHVPGTYDPAAKAPLVVLLHGYRSSGASQEEYFQLIPESERRGFLYAMPDGTTDAEGHRFWNATPACCDFHGSDVDDAGYLVRLLDTVAASYAVDPARVYLVGHSNGGFMALRMACEHATRVTAVVSLAGAATADLAACRPERPVSVLQIHGTSDRTISYEGGTAARPYPSAEQTVALWRRLDGCADQPGASGPPLDLDALLPGAETAVTAYEAGCRDGARVALWSIRDGGHVPPLTPAFATAVVDFLLG